MSLMFPIFALGLVLGLQHAMEADHVVAVASLTRNNASKKRALLQGCAWGFGHSLALLILVMLALFNGLSISDEQARWLEFGVGVMLIILGLKAIRAATIERVQVDINMLMHNGSSSRIDIARTKFKKYYPRGNASHKVLTPLLIGLVHGVAGSAALVLLLAAASLSSLAQAFFYVIVFGFGSIIGMMLLSLIFSFPVGFLKRQSIMGLYILSAGVGITAICIGLHRCLNATDILLLNSLFGLFLL